MNLLRGGSFTNKLVQFVKRDFWRKLIALFFALLLYFYVYNEIRSTPQKIDSVPVDITLPPGLMDVDPKPHFVTLHIKSNRNTTVSASMLRGRASVDYSRYIPGKPYVLTLKPDDFMSPFGVRIEGSDPGEIVLNLQPRMSRDVPVRVTFSNQLSKDYRSSLASCIPSMVRVTGPEQLIRDLKSVSTQPIPLSENVTEGFARLLAITRFLQLWASVLGRFKKLRRAGMSMKRFSACIIVPRFIAAFSTFPLSPLSMMILFPSPFSLSKDVIVSLVTDAME